MSAQDQYLNDGEEALRLAFDGRLSNLWTALPGIIVDVDLSTLTCSVQPAIQGIVTDESGVETNVNLPKLILCPLVFPQGGGFALTFPVAEGDEVLIMWASRAIDAWWQSGGIQKPVEARMHDLSDGFVLPGICSKPNSFPAISPIGVQLRAKDHSVVLELRNDGSVRMTAPGGIFMQGDVTVNGNLTATQVTAAGIPLSTHLHGGVTTGGGNTGVPHT